MPALSSTFAKFVIIIRSIPLTDTINVHSVAIRQSVVKAWRKSCEQNRPIFRYIRPRS